LELKEVTSVFTNTNKATSSGRFLRCSCPPLNRLQYAGKQTHKNGVKSLTRPLSARESHMR